MAQNIEIKARLHDPARQANLAAELSQTQPQTLKQRDVFFKVAEGRLKLRIESVNDSLETGTLIAYRRQDQTGPKTSNYQLVPITNPVALEAALRFTPGVMGEVKKERQLLITGQTRIHLDTVEGLGHFIELEVILRGAQSEADGQAEANRLMEALEIRNEDLIAGAYIDLLQSQK